MAGEVLMTISKDERERAIFRSRRIALADRESDIATVIQIERKKWQGVVADKDAALADKDAALADKEAALTDKDAEISRLRAMLEQI